MTLWTFIMTLAVVIPLVVLWVFTLMDLFKRADLSGPAKVMWVILIIVLPFVGMVIYFVTRPPTPMEKPAKKAPPAALNPDTNQPDTQAP